MDHSGGSIRPVAGADIARQFDRLAPSWDERHGPGSPERLPWRMRAPYLRDVCASCRGARVLDIGCGTGQQLFALADDLNEGMGIDISPAMVERARIQARERDLAERLSFRTLAAEDVCREGLGTFDIVLFVGSLEHMSDPQLSLARAAEVLRTDGTLVLIMVHPWHVRSFYARFAARRGAIPGFRHLPPGALRRCAGAAGLNPADPFGPDRLRQVGEPRRLQHRVLQGLASPAVLGTYIAAFIHDLSGSGRSS